MIAIFFLIFAVSWFVPDHFPPWTSFHTEVPAMFSLLLGLAISLRKAEWREPPSIAIFGVLIIIPIVLIQFAFGQVIYFGDFAVMVLYVVAFVAAWYLGFNASKRLGKHSWSLVEVLSMTMVLVGLVVAFQLLAQWLKVESTFFGWVLEGSPGGRARANLGQPNQAASTQVIAIVSAAILFRTGKLGGWGAWAAITLVTWTIVLTQSRTALVSLLLLACLGICVAFRASFSEKKGLRAISVWSIILWIFLLIGMTLAYHLVPSDSTLNAGGLQQMTQPGTRITMWIQLVFALVQEPLFGYGALQVASAQQVGALLYSGAEQTNYAHNIILDGFTMFGIPLSLSLMFGLFWWVVKRVRSSDNREDILNIVALMMPVAVHSNLEFPHAYTYFLIFSGMCFGMFDEKTATQSGKMMSNARLAIFLPGMLFFVISILGGGVVYEYTRVEEDFRINRFENARVGRPPPEYRPPDVIILTQFKEMLMAMRLRAKQGMEVEELNLLVRVSKRYSWAPLQFRTALALGLNGRPHEATDQLRRIKSLFDSRIYEEAKDSMRMMSSKYPELLKVSIP